MHAEPRHVLDDRGLEFGLRAFDIGVVDAQEKFRAFFFCEQIIEQRRARIADMQQARGRRRETNETGHIRASRKAFVMG